MSLALRPPRLAAFGLHTIAVIQGRSQLGGLHTAPYTGITDTLVNCRLHGVLDIGQCRAVRLGDQDGHGVLGLALPVDLAGSMDIHIGATNFTGKNLLSIILIHFLFLLYAFSLRNCSSVSIMGRNTAFTRIARSRGIALSSASRVTFT